AGDDHGSAEAVCFLADRLADVQSDADVQAHGRIALLVVATDRLLHGDCAADGIDGRVEGDHEAIADGLYLATAVGSNGGAEELEMDAAKVFGLVVAEALHKLRRADKVGEEDGDG